MAGGEGIGVIHNLCNVPILGSDLQPSSVSLNFSFTG